MRAPVSSDKRKEVISARLDAEERAALAALAQGGSRGAVIRSLIREAAAKNGQK